LCEKISDVSLDSFRICVCVCTYVRASGYTHANAHMHRHTHKVIQQGSSMFCDVIVLVIVRLKVHMGMCLTDVLTRYSC